VTAVLVDDLRKSYREHEALRGIDAEHPDRTAVAAAIALEDLDRRRLAGAVRPE